ncbi:MAG TPA: flagellar protein FlaG [Solirubrobacteraceae bacterium]|nr:flagellar protein FlaG [Solirubrobacteraceae bacterium]
MPLFAAQSSDPRPSHSTAPGRPEPALTPSASAPEWRAAPADDIPASPPPEVLDAMGTAADAYERMKTAGRRLHFATDPATGRLTVQVLDPEGNVVTTLPPSKVLDIAAGEALD